jgi:hypothetical protein
VKLRKKKAKCGCEFRGFEPQNLCGKHAAELYEQLAVETSYACKWRKVADDLYEVVMCDTSDNLCRCAFHVDAYRSLLKEEE